MNDDKINPQDPLSVKDWLIEIINKTSIKIVGISVLLTTVLLPVYNNFMKKLNDIQESVLLIKNINNNLDNVNSKLEKIENKLDNVELKTNLTITLMTNQNKALKDFSMDNEIKYNLDITQNNK